MKQSEIRTSSLEYFQDLSDPRVARTRDHTLIDINGTGGSISGGARVSLQCLSLLPAIHGCHRHKPWILACCA